MGWGRTGSTAASLCVALLVPGLARTGTSTVADSSPRAAQDAARPQLPAAVGFALEPIQRGPVPDAQMMGDRAGDLWESRWLGSRAGRAITVRDALTDQHLIDIRADEPLTPASMTKLLSAAAIMSVLPADLTFVTRVLPGEQPDQVVLVAGGDQLLAAGGGRSTRVAGRAGVADLAADTAEALNEQGITGPVQVAMDTSYADGPLLAPDWTDF